MAGMRHASVNGGSCENESELLCAATRDSAPRQVRQPWSESWNPQRRHTRVDRAVGSGVSIRRSAEVRGEFWTSTAELVAILGIPERTLARRRTAGRLAPEESERLLRISSVFEKAVELFDDDVASAVQWLTTPKKALDGEMPLRYARTEPGAREVENLIGRLEYGVFS